MAEGHFYDMAQRDLLNSSVKNLYEAGFLRLGTEPEKIGNHWRWLLEVEGYPEAFAKHRSLINDLAIEISIHRECDESDVSVSFLNKKEEDKPKIPSSSIKTPPSIQEMFRKPEVINEKELFELATKKIGTPEEQQAAREKLQKLYKKSGLKSFTRSAGLYGPTSVQTGRCPDHTHIKLGRVPGRDGVFVCPLDGKKYDFKIGFTKEDGTEVPGSSIEQQIPDWMGNKY